MHNAKRHVATGSCSSKSLRSTANLSEKTADLAQKARKARSAQDRYHRAQKAEKSAQITLQRAREAVQHAQKEAQEEREEREERTKQQTQETQEEPTWRNNPQLRAEFRRPDRYQKRTLMSLSSLYKYPKVARNAKIILAFSCGASTQEIADDIHRNENVRIGERQVRRLIRRWSAEGIMAVIPKNSKLLSELNLGAFMKDLDIDPQKDKDELMHEYQTMIEAHLEQIAERMQRVPINAEELAQLQRKTLELFQQMADEVNKYNVKQILENPAIKDYAKRLLTATAKAAGVKVKNQDPSYQVNLTVASGGVINVITEYFLRKRGGPGRKRKKRGKRGNGIFPVLELFGFKHRIDLTFASIVARYVTAHSMADAPRWLRDLNIHIDEKQAMRIAEQFGADALTAWGEWIESGVPPPGFKWESAAGLDVAIIPDGGRVKLRRYLGGRPLSNGYRRFEGVWRQVLEATVFPFGKRGEEVRKVSSDQLNEFACSTMKSYDHLKVILKAHLERIEIQKAKRVVFAADGNPDLWRIMLELVEELDIPRRKVIYFVDYYHATEHITDFANAKWDLKRVKKSEKKVVKAERSAWIEATKKKLLRKGGEAVMSEMLVQMKGHRGTVRELLESEVGYFVKRLDQMQYPKLKKMGIPLGTGAVESLIRRTNNARTKGNGIFWHEENVDAILHLVCQEKTGRWDEVVSTVGHHRAKRVTPPGTVVTAGGNLWPRMPIDPETRKPKPGGEWAYV